MNITYKGKPVPGQRIEARVSGFKGSAHIQVHVGEALIFEGDCDDPPCHEFIKIPDDSLGLVRITASGLAGTERLEIPIEREEEMGPPRELA